MKINHTLKSAAYLSDDAALRIVKAASRYAHAVAEGRASEGADEFAKFLYNLQGVSIATTAPKSMRAIYGRTA